MGGYEAAPTMDLKKFPTPARPTTPTELIRTPMDRSLLHIEDLSWAPPDRPDEPLFQAVSLEVYAGDRLALTGPSGSGKSTLLRCAVGLEARRQGRIWWRGEPVEAEGMRRFRTRAAYVPQQPVAIARTIADNLSFARQMAAELDADVLDEQAQHALLDTFGLGGLDWQRDFAGLSVGERQRVVLVRSLTLQPDLLLLDEPTASLDADSAHAIERHLTDYVDAEPDRAFVWVSHQPDQIARLGATEHAITSLGDFATGAPDSSAEGQTP